MGTAIKKFGTSLWLLGAAAVTRCSGCLYQKSSSSVILIVFISAATNFFEERA
jgi:hypothetical protein